MANTFYLRMEILKAMDDLAEPATFNDILFLVAQNLAQPVTPSLKLKVELDLDTMPEINQVGNFYFNVEKLANFIEEFPELVESELEGMKRQKRGIASSKWSSQKTQSLRALKKLPSIRRKSSTGMRSRRGTGTHSRSRSKRTATKIKDSRSSHSQAHVKRSHSSHHEKRSSGHSRSRSNGISGVSKKLHSIRKSKDIIDSEFVEPEYLPSSSKHSKY